MSQAANHSELPASAAPRRAGRAAGRPFAGVIDVILVQDPVPFSFAGSVSRAHAEAGWTWVYRDLCPDLISADGIANGNFLAKDLEVVLPDVLTRMKDALAAAAKDQEKDRRLRAALGSTEARDALPAIMMALRSRALLAKAQAFGKAVNAIGEDGALGVALQSMPLQDPALASLLFHAALGQIANPTRLITTIIKLSGNATEVAVIRMGFSPVIDAILAHAQNQIHILQPMGAFADIDLVCRSLERFHRLVRSLGGYIEFARGSRWAMVLSAITKQVSDRIEPRLRDVVADINQAMRRGREGSDRLDNDRILAAINGVYLLATIRECRDSLALNALFEQAWSQTGQALEVHLQRNLDLIRQHPADPVIGARLDAGIKMAEVRFNPEYAETLKRARAAAERRS
ncbi:hypothetical protein ASD04_17945 [Devosia sp. Root436]|uniref:hypothetical protein n=1 Tax=Devosia sp. Root436 TaxID=1736537 RepID=UPI0006F7BF56|nr:hypothetical protein [Devosia sp. Root436]KQX41947.1 hypothetical protein ASD04_17945 [Devosia sp. Root436]